MLNYRLAKNQRQRRRPRRRQKNRRGNSGGIGNPPATTGDIPRRPKATYMTLSHPVPRTTRQMTVRQELGPNVLTAAAGSAVTGTYNFQLSQLDQVAAFQALFDVYRIDAIRIRIAPQQNALGLTTNSTTTLVELYNVVDYDDNTALATVAKAREYENCIILAPGESCERTFQPRAAIAAYQGALTAFGNVGGMWIDQSYPNVQHYGLKVIIPAATVAQTQLQSWDIFFEMYVSFKEVF